MKFYSILLVLVSASGLELRGGFEVLSLGCWTSYPVQGGHSKHSSNSTSRNSNNTIVIIVV